MSACAHDFVCVCVYVRDCVCVCVQVRVHVRVRAYLIPPGVPALGEPVTEQYRRSVAHGDIVSPHPWAHPSTPPPTHTVTHDASHTPAGTTGPHGAGGSHGNTASGGIRYLDADIAVGYGVGTAGHRRVVPGGRLGHTHTHTHGTHTHAYVQVCTHTHMRTGTHQHTHLRICSKLSDLFELQELSKQLTIV